MIGCANLEGSTVDPSFIVAGDVAPRAVAVDGQHIYSANAAAGPIGRANLDGSARDPNFIVGPAPWGLAVDSLPHPTTTTVTCSPAAPDLPAATRCTATVTDTAALGAPAGTVDFRSTGPGSSKRNGTADLSATAPGAGTLLLTGRGIRRLTRFVSRAGTVKLTIEGQPITQRRLGRTGRATITVRITYTPSGGDPNTRSKKLTLRRDRR
jgi:hypothetical protein